MGQSIAQQQMQVFHDSQTFFSEDLVRSDKSDISFILKYSNLKYSKLALD